ncbi:MAG: hypothetical protein AAF517_20250 [Planctomycetota bacterium]
MRRFFVWTLACGAVTLASCSSFERDWEQALELRDEDELTGAWSGRWLSDYNGHTGALRCVVRKDEDGNYYARYRASFAKILRFEYELPVRFQSCGGLYNFQSSANLGWLWGTHESRGEIAGSRFTAAYRASVDHGSFELERQTPEGR